MVAGVESGFDIVEGLVVSELVSSDSVEDTSDTSDTSDEVICELTSDGFFSEQPKLNSNMDINNIRETAR